MDPNVVHVAPGHELARSSEPTVISAQGCRPGRDPSAAPSWARPPPSQPSHAAVAALHAVACTRPEIRPVPEIRMASTTPRRRGPIRSDPRSEEEGMQRSIQLTTPDVQAMETLGRQSNGSKQEVTPSTANAEAEARLISQ